MVMPGTAARGSLGQIKDRPPNGCLEWLINVAAWPPSIQHNTANYRTKQLINAGAGTTKTSKHSRLSEWLSNYCSLRIFLLALLC